MRALRVSGHAARLGMARLASVISPVTSARLGPLELRSVDAPEPPDDGWVRLAPRLAGICGSDLAMLEGRASVYFDPIVSFPFTPGHEIVADVLDGELAGLRVVVVPVLHCATRGVDPPCPACAIGEIQRCERTAFGHLAAGLQTGFCTDTGGGWGDELVAHVSQLVPLPDDLDDEAGVMVEPAACAVHAVDGVLDITPPGPIAVIGAGTVGLLTVAALLHAGAGTADHPLLVAARYPHQQALVHSLAADVGATHHVAAVPADRLTSIARARTGSHVAGEQLTGGVARVIDCVSSGSSIADALTIVAPGGTVDLVGMPGPVTVDLTGVWHREVAVRGRYAYRRPDFETAVDLVRRFDLGRLVSATYPLDDHVEAIAHAAAAGRRGAVKIAFRKS